MAAPAKTKSGKPRKPHWTTTARLIAKQCKECGKKFKTPWGNRIYCSVTCSAARQLRVQLRRKKKAERT